MGASVTVLQDAGALAALRGPWDALADACRRPLCASAWMLGWAAHAGAGAAPRVAVVRDGEVVVGIVPLALTRGPARLRRLELLSAAASTGLEPLALPGREEEVARLAAPALAATAPRADVLALDAVPAGSPWPALLAAHWPGARAGLLRRESEEPEPLVSLTEADFDAWLQGKSSNFRQQVRRARRKLDGQGGAVRRTATDAELDADLTAFVTLHRGRWEDRGGTGVLDGAVEAMLRAAGPELLEQGRLDLWNVDVDGRTVGSQLWLQAGGTVTMWLSGSDDDYAEVRPAVLIMAAVVEDAYARGLRPVSLGAGGQDYKRRFSDAEAGVETWSLPLPGPRLPLALGAYAARAARREAAARLTPEQKARAREALGRVRPRR